MKFVVVLAIALVMRLFLIPLAWHVDMDSNAGWGEWIVNNGKKNFYSNNVWVYSWPTQPPLASSIYAWDKHLHTWILGQVARVDHVLKKYGLGSQSLSQFVEWFGYGKISKYSPYQAGYLATIKLVAIFADLGIAVIIYSIGKRLLWPALYLVLPFSWYISSLWGQYDQLAFLGILIAIFLIGGKYSFLSPPIAMMSVLAKPVGIIFLPLIFFSQFKFKLGIFKILLGGIMAILVVFWATWGYTEKNMVSFWNDDLLPKVLFKSEYRYTSGAFNFWRIWLGDTLKNQNLPILFLPGRVWAMLLFSVCYIYALTLIKNNREGMWKAFYVVGAGAWLFMMNMLERYYFPAIVLGLVVCVFRPKLLRYWFIMAFVFFVNLYDSWRFPEVYLLSQILDFNNALITQCLAVLNIVFVILFVKKMNEHN